MKQHEIFSPHSTYLIPGSFQPTPQQLHFAKHSLIEKQRARDGVQQLLFCGKSGVEEEQFVSVNRKNLIQSERKKYIDFIKKNYNQRISEQLLSIHALRSRIRQFQAKQQEELQRAQLLAQGKPVRAHQPKPQEPSGGKKKRKTEVKEKKVEKQKKVSKKEQELGVVLISEVREVQLQQGPSVEESVELNLINSPSEQEYGNDYE